MEFSTCLLNVKALLLTALLPSAHLLVLEAVVVVVDAVEVVPQPRPAVAAHEALLVVVVRPRQDRVRLDQLGAGVTRVCNTDTVRIYIY